MNREWMPVVAGVFEIVAAVCAGIGALALVFSSIMINSIPEIQRDSDVPLEFITGLLVSIAVVVCAFGLVSLIGGICGVRRRGWGWTLAGAITAVFIVAPAGILALVLTLFGEKEFAERSASDASPTSNAV